MNRLGIHGETIYTKDGNKTLYTKDDTCKIIAYYKKHPVEGRGWTKGKSRREHGNK